MTLSLLPFIPAHGQGHALRWCKRLAFLCLASTSLLLSGQTAQAQCSISQTIGGGAFSGWQGAGQSFTATCSGQITEVAKVGTATVTLLEIRAGAGAGGAVLYSQASPVMSGGSHTLTAPVPVSSGQMYTVLFYSPPSNNGDVYTGDEYAGGNMYGYAGGSWVSFTGSDLTFSVTINSPCALALGVPSITASGPTTFCEGNSVNLTADSPDRGTALQFDGVNDYVNMAYGSSFNPSAYTMEAWVQPLSTGNQNIIVLTDNSGPGANWSHQLRISGGKFQHYLYDGSGKTVTGSTNVVAGQWFHVAATASSGGQMRLFVNGVEEGTAGSVNTLWSGGNQFRIGSSSSGFGFFNGKIDEVRVFTSVIPQSGIQSWMGSPVTTFHPNYANLHTYLKFNEGSGTTTVNSQTSQDATLVNGPVWTTSNAFNYSFTWSPAAGLNTTTGEVVTATPTATTTYTVTVTASTGCTNSASQQVNVDVIPSFTVVANPASIELGQSSTLEITSSNGSWSYQWTGGGPDGGLTPTTGPSSVVVTPTATGTFQYGVGTSNNGCISAQFVDLEVTSGSIPISALTGTYTVNPAMPTNGNNFQDIPDLTMALNTLGVSGPVTVNFTPGTYTTPIMLGTIQGSSATNTITLNGNDAVMNFCSGSAAFNVNMITLDGTDNIVIDNFTLNANCTYGTGFRLMNFTNNVTISNNDINVPASGANSTSVHNKGIWATDAGLLTISGNTIDGGRRGIEIYNQTAALTISDNILTNSYEYGLNIVNADGIMVNDNTVNMRGNYTSSVAINGSLLNGFTFDSNLLINAGRAGLQLNNSNNGAGASQATIVNNRIGQFQSSPKAYGVYAYSVNDVDLYHNSVKIDQATANIGMVLKGAGYDVRNNILMAAGVTLSTSLSSLDMLSNNAYYNTTGGSIANISGGVADLLALQAKGFDITGSFDNVNPGFTMGTTFNTALRTTALQLANVPSALVLVSVDFEDESRPQGFGVSLGADEFSGAVRLMAAATATLDADVYPNPFQSSLTVQVQDMAAGDVQVTLTDLMGRQIFTRNHGVAKGVNTITVVADQNLAQGVYLLQVTQGEATSTFRVIKQ